MLYRILTKYEISNQQKSTNAVFPAYVHEALHMTFRLGTTELK